MTTDGRLVTLYRSIDDDREPDDGDGDAFNTVVDTDEIWSFAYDTAGKVSSIEIERCRGTIDSTERRPPRTARTVALGACVYTGVPDKSS